MVQGINKGCEETISVKDSTTVSYVPAIFTYTVCSQQVYYVTVILFVMSEFKFIYL